MRFTPEQIYFGKIKDFSSALSAKNYSMVLFVSGNNRYEIEASKIAYESLANCESICKTITIPTGEQAKSQSVVELLWSTFAKIGIDRHSLIVSVGGGAISDSVGFAASTFMRGVHFASIPTTILSAVDATIGGKRGINTKFAKNIIGTFWPAEFVYIDKNIFDTLDDFQKKSGFAEILKMSFLRGGELLDSCNASTSDDISALISTENFNKMLKLSITYKQEIVNTDMLDNNGKRCQLNYGHTFGHAIEVACGHALPHGICVMIGMDMAAKFANMQGLANKDIVVQQQQIASKFCLSSKELLPIFNELVPDKSVLKKYIKYDKKSNGQNVDIVYLKNFGNFKKSSFRCATIYEFLIEYQKL